MSSSACATQLAYAQERSHELTASMDALTHVPPGGLEQSPIYHLERGRLFWAQNNEAASLFEFERAVAIDPTLAAAYLGLAEANFYFGRFDKALSGYRRYVEASAWGGRTPPMCWRPFTSSRP